MRFRLIILLLFFSCSAFAQNSLTVDTLLQHDTISAVPVLQADTQKAVAEPVIKARKPRKVRRQEAKIDSVPKPVFNPGNAKDDKIGPIGVFLILLFFALLFYGTYRFVGYLFSFRSGGSPFLDGVDVEDQWKRMTMSRRDYYRNVYLKSEAWQRKRYVVLKRDRGICVYCGSKATQVHHTRYAKWNVGKEPIEWLVSVCATCHEDIHR